MANKMEILAPAGSEEALKAAVFSGCDAVYLGGSSFSARANARNFDNEQLKKAVDFCRQRDVKVHVTVNTLIKDSELLPVLDFVWFLCSIPVDAVLIQDMGLFSLLRKAAPELPIHASTQMSLHTPGGVKLLYELGAVRAVLARELSSEEMEEIGKSCPIELEAFVHGALCMSLSGQCGLSAVLGGRSGNRGLCAQPCRLPFSAPGGTGHDLSLKDMSLLNRTQELKAAGISSLKIEGRMKRPEYVAAAVSACKKALEGTEDEELFRDLRAVFSRSGFTDGYFTGKTGRDMFGVRTKEDVTGATEKVLSRLKNIYKSELQRVKISFEAEQNNEEIRLSATDLKGNSVCVKEKADMSVPALSPERCEEQLKKTGGTPFAAESVNVPKSGMNMPVSLLNSMRRQALDGLLLQRARAAEIPFDGDAIKAEPPPHEKRQGKLPLWLKFRSPEQVFPEARKYSAVILPVSLSPDEVSGLCEKGFSNIILEFPRAVFGKGGEDRLLELASGHMSRGFDKFMCHNPGEIYLARQLEAEIYGGFSLNIFNTASLEFFRELGLCAAELSPELTGEEISGLGSRLPRGVTVYGRQPLMVTRNCPLANSQKGCLSCKTPGYITDRMGKRFPVMCESVMNGQFKERVKDRAAQIFNCLPLWIPSETRALEHADFGILSFTVENSVECGEITGLWESGGKPLISCTGGLFKHGVL